MTSRARRFASVALLSCLAAAIPARAQSASTAALRFFGTGANQQDRVRIAIDDNTPGPDASAPCDLGAGSFTIEFWIRGTLADNPTSSSGGDQEFNDFRWIEGNTVIDRDIFGGSVRDWGISIAGGFVRFGTGRADVSPLDPVPEHTIEGNINVLTGAWRHVAVTRDAATGIKRIFVDGVLDYASPPNRSRDDISYPNAGVPSQQTPWGPFIVLAAEKHDAGAEYPSFRGYLDEVRFWNRALTQSELLTVHNRLVPPSSPGLVGAYRFEEGAGASVADSSAAGSPVGQLIAGITGNGQWALRSADPANTAPVFPRPGDTNADNLVNGADLSVLLAQFGQSVTPSTGADFNADAQVNGADLSILLANFGG